MRLDHYLVTCFVPLAVWILISGLDDLWISLVFLFIRRQHFPWPADSELDGAVERRIAIFVPLWREYRVIGQMLEHNLSAIRYSAYDFFVGVYPNDEPTARAVEEVARADPRVHMVVTPHDGPTSKGDCLNWIHRFMVQYEAEKGVHYEILMTHDAEDLAHSESLRLVNWFSRDYAMVQVPVLALPTPLREPTHGLYCDEFAEFQVKDIPVRQRLGGFLPANGVGTGFVRSAMERLASRRQGMIFDPASLTEDYENGFRLHALGYRQLFLPLRFRGGQPVATREYFPRRWGAAVRQRSRWVAGIALQSWQNHGWRVPWRQRYWFWRDRKGLVGNLVSPLANLAFFAGLAGIAMGDGKLMASIPQWLTRLWLFNYVSAFVQIAIRGWSSARVYGWGFAAFSPLRAAWGNLLNFAATIAAIRQFAAARVHQRSMAWRKTDHVYPRARLGEVLVHMRAASMQDVETAARNLPERLRIGEYLLDQCKISEEHLYHALSLQSGIPCGPLTAAEISGPAIRALPLRAARRWKVLPFRLEAGHLHIAVADLPTRELTDELAALSAMQIHYRLVCPTELARLTREYLPDS